MRGAEDTKGNGSAGAYEESMTQRARRSAAGASDRARTTAARSPRGARGGTGSPPMQHRCVGWNGAPSASAAPIIRTVLRFEDILETVERYHPKVDEALLRRAYVVSAHAHRHQLRSSGEPYLVHPLAVAMILAEMKLDETTIATGLLHDVLEDSEITKEKLAELFGPDVAHLVDGVTKIG